MAERGCRDGNSRRPSFRKTLTDAALPPEYLDSLEQKRRQLDESIHKYIAAKEREYKVYERDLKHQLKLVQHDGERESSDRAQSSFAQDSERRPQLGVGGSDAERRPYDNDVVLIDGDGGDNDAPAPPKSALSALTDRRASQERDQEFVGLFTPAYLPALGHVNTSLLLRTSSEPPVGQSHDHDDSQTRNGAGRSNSDTAVPTKSKRPSQLQLAHRTSSSGSSADGKLASALKSPTQSAKPKRKRVSLAVGDVIVAPSDSVPLSMSNNSTPSHSRTRSPVSVLETSSIQETRSSPLPLSSSHQTQMKVKSEDRHTDPEGADSNGLVSSHANPSSTRTSRKIDPDGDLFDLENEEMDHSDQDHVFGNPFESEDDVVGRIDQRPASLVPLPQTPGDAYVEDEGIVPEYADDIDDDDDVDDGHIEFGPGSATASQQPTSPGFRRPSVSMDPVYTGSDWTRAEHEAVVGDVYGSRYIEPGSKGSFTAGSLGESYMARNAEKLMRNRAGKDQGQVRS